MAGLTSGDNGLLIPAADGLPVAHKASGLSSGDNGVLVCCADGKYRAYKTSGLSDGDDGVLASAADGKLVAVKSECTTCLGGFASGVVLAGGSVSEEIKIPCKPEKITFSVSNSRCLCVVSPYPALINGSDITVNSGFLLNITSDTENGKNVFSLTIGENTYVSTHGAYQVGGFSAAARGLGITAIDNGGFLTRADLESLGFDLNRFYYTVLNFNDTYSGAVTVNHTCSFDDVPDFYTAWNVCFRCLTSWYFPMVRDQEGQRAYMDYSVSSSGTESEWTENGKCDYRDDDETVVDSFIRTTKNTVISPSVNSITFPVCYYTYEAYWFEDFDFETGEPLPGKWYIYIVAESKVGILSDWVYDSEYPEYSTCTISCEFHDLNGHPDAPDVPTWTPA